ncbi:hypothetical protein OIU76_007244 [Salix suchowensis]|nr:hypothetical protein OIU76_007244 [Salix suchowensis]
MVQSRGLGSDRNCNDLGMNLPDSLSSSQSAVSGVQGSRQALPPSKQLRSVHDDGVRSSSPSEQTHGIARNPKEENKGIEKGTHYSSHDRHVQFQTNGARVHRDSSTAIFRLTVYSKARSFWPWLGFEV